MAQLDLRVLVKTAGEKELDRVATKMSKVQKGLAIGAAAAGAVVVAGLVDAGKALIDIERLNAQTEAAIRSTGGVANVSAGHVEELAEAMERTTTIEREVVQEAENMLLTFSNVRNEAGKGNKVFDQTTQAALDMSVALGTDAKSAAMQLGKALNDPVEGLSRLARAGVQFTDEQEALVKSLQETGDLLGAQKVILAEVERQFGGSAEAFAETTAGKIQRFQNDVGNMFESIILGAVKVADFLGEGGTWYPLGKPGEAEARIRETRLVATQEAWEAAQAVTSAAAESYAAHIGEVEDAAFRVATVVPDAITARWQDTRDAAFEMAVQHALGVLDGQDNIKVAFEALTRLQEEEQTRAQRIAYLQGMLHDEQLAAGLNDGREGVRGAASATRAAIVAELASLGVDAYNSGLSVPANIAAGIYANAHLADGATSYLAAKVSGYLPRSEPKYGPLKGITKVGAAIVHGVTDDIFGMLGTADRAGSLLAAAVAPTGLIGGSLTAGSGGGEVHYHYHSNLTVEGNLQARNTAEAEDALMRVSRFAAVGGSA